MSQKIAGGKLCEKLRNTWRQLRVVLADSKDRETAGTDTTNATDTGITLLT